jgi:threonine/homoserine/homoserine lactone efflux protein
MIDMGTLSVFAVACTALALTPGPDMLLIASRSASQGRAAGFATLAGIQAGTYTHAMAAALGLSQLLLTVPVAYDVVRYAGAVYLVYLAWQTVRTSSRMKDGGAVPMRPYSHAAMFRQGFVTNVLNPKIALFVLALFPQFVQPEAGSLFIQIMLLGTVFNVVGFIINGAVIMGVTRFRSMLGASGHWQRRSRYFLGAVFTGLAARLVFDTQR